MKKKIIVTGGAGFIGSNLIDELLSFRNYHIYCIDNLSTGKLDFLKKAKKNKDFKFINADLNNIKKIKKYFKNTEFVFHLAALADVKNSYNEREKHYNNNIKITQNIIELCIKNQIRRIIFTSTASVYGNTKNVPTKENEDFPIQNSFYSATKISSEALLTAAGESHKIKISILRLVSVMGPRYTHGHLHDFYFKLKKNKKQLEVLGNGLQKKSYIHIDDVISAFITILKKQKNQIEIFNVGTDAKKNIKNSVRIILKYLKLKPKIIYENKKIGWIGDIPNIQLDCKKLKNMGWKTKYTINEAIISTLDWIDRKYHDKKFK